MTTKPDWEAHFNGRQYTSASLPLSNDVFLEFVLRTAPLKLTDIVLDIGCGRAEDAKRLASAANCAVLGLDLAINELQRSREGQLLINARVESTPLRDGSIDAAYACHLFHLVRDRQRVIAEMHRVLRRFGYFFILTASEEDVRRPFLNRYFPSLASLDAERYVRIEHLKSELASAGFRGIKSISILLRQESADERFFHVILRKLWSSLCLLSEEEYRAGVEKILSDRQQWIRQGSIPHWSNHKTIVYGQKV